jgi:hypothetical protein
MSRSTDILKFFGSILSCKDCGVKPDGAFRFCEKHFKELKESDWLGDAPEELDEADLPNGEDKGFS